MAKDGWLSRGQKLQIYTLIGLAAISGTIYGVLGLLNGFDIVNQQILDNWLPLAYIGIAALSIAPVYRKADDKIHKATKQLGWAGLLFLATSPPIWIYYLFNQPETGWDRLANKASYLATVGGLLNFVVTYHLKKVD